MTERLISDDKDAHLNFRDLQRECGNPQACKAYFKTEDVKVNGRWQKKILPGTYCTCSPPEQKG